MTLRKLNSVSARITRLLQRRYEYATTAEIAKHLKMPPQQVSSVTSKLCKQGRIKARHHLAQSEPLTLRVFHMTYRIVDTDNFGGDYPDEKFVEGRFDSREAAQARADYLNGPYDDEHFNNSRYFKVVEMPYELQPRFEP